MKKTAAQIAAIVLKKLSTATTTDPKEHDTFARPVAYKTEGSNTYTHRLTPDPQPSMPDGTEEDLVGVW